MIKGTATSITLILLGSALPGWALNLTDFRACIDSSGGSYGSVCQLDPGVYDITSQLVIGRDVEIEGTIGDPEDVVIRRTSSIGTTDTVFAYGGLTLYIHDLTFDGNRGTATSCGTSFTDPVAELNVGFVAFVTVQNVNIVRAPWNGMYLGGTGATLGVPGASTISYSQVGMQNGLHYSPNSYNLSGPQTANRVTGVFLGDVYTGAWANSFAYNGTAAINAFQGNQQYIVDNQLYMNRYEQPGGVSGGQIYITPDSPYVSVANNLIDGNYWNTANKTTSNTDILCNPFQSYHSFGIEAHGEGHRYFNNQVQNHLGYGIILRETDNGSHYSMDNTIVSGYDPFCTFYTCSYVEHYIENNGGAWASYQWAVEYYMAGLVVNGDGAVSANNVVLDHVRVRNNAHYGLGLHWLPNGPGFIDSVNTPSAYACVTGNSSGNLYTTHVSSAYSSLPALLCP